MAERNSGFGSHRKELPPDAEFKHCGVTSAIRFRSMSSPTLLARLSLREASFSRKVIHSNTSGLPTQVSKFLLRDGLLVMESFSARDPGELLSVVPTYGIVKVPTTPSHCCRMSCAHLESARY